MAKRGVLSSQGRASRWSPSQSLSARRRARARARASEASAVSSSWSSLRTSSGSGSSRSTRRSRGVVSPGPRVRRASSRSRSIPSSAGASRPPRCVASSAIPRASPAGRSVRASPCSAVSVAVPNRGSTRHASRPSRRSSGPPSRQSNNGQSWSSQHSCPFRQPSLRVQSGAAGVRCSQGRVDVPRPVGRRPAEPPRSSSSSFESRGAPGRSLRGVIRLASRPWTRCRDSWV